MIDGPHAVVAEHTRKHSLDHLAVGQHVRDAAGNAQIVFEYREAPVFESHQIRAYYRNVDAARHVQATHLARDNAVLENLAFVIKVFEKQVERGDALSQAAFDGGPLSAGEDARQHIVGENLLGALFTAIHGEGYSLMQKRSISSPLAVAQLLWWHLTQTFMQRLIARARRARGLEHFVVGAVEFVASEGRVKAALRVGVETCHRRSTRNGPNGPKW